LFCEQQRFEPPAARGNSASASVIPVTGAAELQQSVASDRLLGQLEAFHDDRTWILALHESKATWMQIDRAKTREGGATAIDTGFCPAC
jgi:hypothetical protein